MINFFSDDVRRNPYPLYDDLRRRSPLFHDPDSGIWMVFDYAGVKRVLEDHDAFSSHHGPLDAIVFMDPPRHTKLRALVSLAFMPRSIANLERRIGEISRQLLDRVTNAGTIDVATDFALPLPMTVIAEMLGIPPADRQRFKHWNDIILMLSHTIPAGKPDSAAAARATSQFAASTAEISDYLTALLADRRAAPQDDLLTRLVQAEVDGQRLSHREIVAFFQLLLLAGQETTTILITNAVLSFMEHPAELARLRSSPKLLQSAIEEVLRFRSPVSWMYRLTRREVELHRQTIPARSLVLTMIGSANRDPKQFADPDRFDVGRTPNTHIAFGHGIHFCLGAALARLEAKIALTDFLKRFASFEPTSAEPWPPRKGLHVHGPASLPVRFRPATP